MTVAQKTTDLAEFLDEQLAIRSVPDFPEAHNGLQVENRGSVSVIAAAVDASEAAIQSAVQAGADFMLVHHGLLWGGSAAIVGRRYRKLRLLIEHNIALYSAHLPLDVHRDWGNNVRLLSALGVAPKGQFGMVEGELIGWWGETDCSRDSLADVVQSVVGHQAFIMPFGPERIRRVGVVTGAAGSLISEAKAAGLDAFVTGEGAHHTYFDAQELGITVLYAGHYATETFGVKAVAEAVAARFDLPWRFVDLPTGL